MKPDEFETLYGTHAAALLAFLEYRTGNIELARDVHADTFERVLKTRWRFDPRKGSQKTWLYSIALNCLRDQGRRRGAEARALERIATGRNPNEHEWQDQQGRLDARDAVLRGMESLSDEEREAVALRYGADLSLEEIARVTGTPTTTVKGRLHRSLNKLRETVD
jgi:RNA polymerase sigma-70 factor (ECF subfamily)